MNLHGIISKVKSNITRAVLSPAVLSGEPQPLHAYNWWVKKDLSYPTLIWNRHRGTALEGWKSTHITPAPTEVILAIEEQENPKSSLPIVLATSGNTSILIALLDFEN